MSGKLNWLKDLKEIKIMGKLFKIIWISDLKEKFDEVPTSLGKINVARQKITMVNHYAPELILDNLVHEILHGLDSHLVLKLDEDAVTRLGCGLTQIILDNFELRPKRKKRKK